MPRKISNRGQTAVFVLILLFVGLTIGLSLSTRTFRDLQGSSGSDLSSRAFSAAEAGIEDALRQDLAAIADQPATEPEELPNNATYSYQVVESTLLAQTVLRDNTVQVTLKQTNGDNYEGTIDLYWVNSSDSSENSPGSKPALEISLIKKIGGNYSFVRHAVNAEAKSNNFHNPNGSTQGQFTNRSPGSFPVGTITYTNRLTINISDDDTEAIRIRPLYNKASLAVEGEGLPAQTYVITSSGVAGTSTRVVQVVRTVPALPPIFDYVLFNGSTLPLQK